MGRTGSGTRVSPFLFRQGGQIGFGEAKVWILDEFHK